MGCDPLIRETVVQQELQDLCLPGQKREENGVRHLQSEGMLGVVIFTFSAIMGALGYDRQPERAHRQTRPSHLTPSWPLVIEDYIHYLSALVGS